MSGSLPNDGIELLYTSDCKAWAETKANLERAIKKLGLNEDIKLIVIDTLEQAYAHNFFASPTIHVQGIDVDPRGRRISRRGLGSGRPYFWQNKSYTAPPVDLILAGLKEFYNQAAQGNQ